MTRNCLCPGCNKEIEYGFLCKKCRGDSTCMIDTIAHLEQELQETRRKLEDAEGSCNIAIGMLILLTIAAAMTAGVHAWNL